MIVLPLCLLFFGDAPCTLDAYRDGAVSPGDYSNATRFQGVRDRVPQFSPTTDDRDLSVTGWVKHDGQRPYFNPRLEVEPGVFYSPALGDRKMGLNIALGDLDEKEKGAGNFGHFHHEDWWAGAKDIRAQLRTRRTLHIHANGRRK